MTDPTKNGETENVAPTGQRRDAAAGLRRGRSKQEPAGQEAQKTGRRKKALGAEKPPQGHLSGGEDAMGPAPQRRNADKAEQARLLVEALRPNNFPIVGIGASAGGLEALEAFVSAIEAKSGMAFVVVSHSHPDHKTRLPEILERKAKVPVVLLKDGTRLAPDTIYIPPSDLDPIILDGLIRLQKRQNRADLHMPIDIFLRSLAQDRGEAAGCVILSGTGTDGTQGVRQIKEKAGVTVAQNEASARHWGMPRSAIETGLVDYVLAPSRMPAQLVAYFRHPAAIRDEPQENHPHASELDMILSFLAERTRHDFSMYKKSTLIRRIQRRMSVTRSSSVSEYLEFLHDNPAEPKALFQDLLIGVTNFFRDPEVFAFLKEKVLPDLLARSQGKGSFRAWIPGCATGEEAYSVAILVKECMRELKVNHEIQIFATDIDAKAIEKARQGVYLVNIATDVSAERLERFFVPGNNLYQIKKEIRESVIFAEQNVLRDPPFMNLDLLVCRNLLIYLKPAAQAKVIPLFYYSLKPAGVLFLGTSEGTGRFAELFQPIDKKFSLYQKQSGRDIRPRIQFPSGAKRPLSPVDPRIQRPDGIPDNDGIAQAVTRLLLEEHTPACAIVDHGGNILYIHGRTGAYLEPAQGKANLRITDMAREGVRTALSSALHQAFQNNRPIRKKGLQVKTNGQHVRIDLTVKPISAPSLKDCLMVLFEQVGAASPQKGNVGEPKTDRADALRNSVLEQDLATVRDDYHTTLRELEASNEELISVNEEMHSSNEELQSTNEELESSKEELQSLNEELSTVNNELYSKIEEVQDAYDSITDVLNSTRIAIVFTDTELRIKRFTAEAARLINLIDTDAGRPLDHISHNLQYENLTQKVRRVIQTQSSFEEEVRTQDGQWYRMSIMVHQRADALEGRC
ncbi:MAG: chemotaxis protein CheB [Desulfobacteraceae bacterium]|nr:MAG: chemotaxis protein CheB [Desulfobacteraceae bacterium]